MRHPSLLPPALALLLAVAMCPACVDIINAAQYTEREEKKFAVSGKPDVVLGTFDGSIEIRPSNQPEVVVTVEKHAASKDTAAQIDVHTEQTGNHVVVDVRVPKGSATGFGWHASRSAKLIVSLPASADVRASSGDGSIDIERISGALELRSGDGTIQGRDLTGDLKVHTGDGSIKIETLTGTIDADTGDGSVSVAGKLSRVRARSGDGGITIRAAPGSSTAADWDITTGDGSVVLELPDGFGGELDAHTGDGHVSVQDVTLSNVTGEISKNSVRGRLGAGGAQVRVRTGDGSITLRR
jgi:hypothetical protein